MDTLQKPRVSIAGKPKFTRCRITGPDGKSRPGWELWLGDHCFGRADEKDLLLKSLERQQQPPQSFHWREVHRQRMERNRWRRRAQEEAWEREEEVAFPPTPDPCAES